MSAYLSTCHTAWESLNMKWIVMWYWNTFIFLWLFKNWIFCGNEDSDCALVGYDAVCLLCKYQHFEVIYCLHLCSCGMFRPTYNVAWCHNPCDHSLNTYCLVPLRNFICVELESKLKLTKNSTVKDYVLHVNAIA